MPSPSPQLPDDVRLRLVLKDPLPLSLFPAGFSLRAMLAADAPDIHALLIAVFDDEEPDFATWWAKRAGDAEFDPRTVWLALGEDAIVGVCWCWRTGYIKDVAVAPAARRHGLAEALVLGAVRDFRDKGVAHIDLKTNRLANAAAYALYRKLGFVEVDWAG